MAEILDMEKDETKFDCDIIRLQRLIDGIRLGTIRTYAVLYMDDVGEKDKIDYFPFKTWNFREGNDMFTLLGALKWLSDDINSEWSGLLDCISEQE